MSLLAAFIEENIFLAGGLFWLIQRRGGARYLKAKFSGGIPNVVFTHWEHRRSQFLRLLTPENPSRRPIVFLGDSMTEQGEWSEMFPGGVPVLNRGINGDTSRGLLRRLEEIAALEPAAVFLMIGTNDPFLLRLTPEQTARNIRMIVDKLRAAVPDVVIYVQSILPLFDPMRSNRWIREVNDEIRTLDNGQSMRWVDLFPQFLDGDRLDRKYSADGLHFNGEGYQQWARLIGPLVRAHLDAPETRPEADRRATGRADGHPNGDTAAGGPQAEIRSAPARG